MTAFADLLDLRTAVVEQVGRADIVDVFPRLVKLAEANFNRNIRTKAQITTTTLTFASGVAALPADFAEAIGLYNARGYEYVQQPVQATQITDGTRYFYSIAGSNITVNGHDGDLTLQYYATLPTITDSMTDTNWLLTKYPGAYLYGVSLEAAKHLRDAEMAKAYAALLRQELDDLSADDFRVRYARARVRVQGVTP